MQKFAIALYKKLDVGIALNAAAHISLGLVGMASKEQQEEMKFVDYIDADDTIHPSISAWPCIMLRGTQSDLKKMITGAHEHNLLVVDFTHTMTGGGYQEQLANTRTTKQDDLIYYGVGIYGPKEVVEGITKKMSLWR